MKATVMVFMSAQALCAKGQMATAQILEYNEVGSPMCSQAPGVKRGRALAGPKTSSAQAVCTYSYVQQKLVGKIAKRC